MKNTLDAIRYGLETLNVTPKELFSLIESSNGYDGDDYNRWLANEIIKLAEKDEVGYSQLLAKWFNMISSIIDEYSDDSVKPCYEQEILRMVANNVVYTVGMSEDNIYGADLSELDWGSKVDLPFNYDFIETLPEDLQSALVNNGGATIFVKFNPKSSFKKSADIVSDGKINNIPIRSNDALMMYRMCSIARALEDSGTNFKFVFMADTKFLYDSENEEVIRYLLTYFKYSGFVVNSKDLYEGSFTSEEYAICECSLRDINDRVQNGFVLKKLIDEEGVVKEIGRPKRYSSGINMLDALYRENPLSLYEDNVPMLDKNFNVVGACKGRKDAYGYLCKDAMDRCAILTCYPVRGSKYIAITDDNILSLISYYGVSTAMNNSGMSVDIPEIIDGHPDFMNLVSNCVPIFLFDINSKFCDLGIVENKSGKKVRLRNRFDISSSEIVSQLIDKSSVYFSYESKELMNICKGYLDYFKENYGEDMTGKTFEEIRKESANDNLNKAYLTALSRCKDYVSSLYRGML